MERALVTGASSGIGYCFCRTLAEMGADLIMISNQEKELEECAATIRSEYGVRVDTMYLDLTAADCAEQILEFVDSRDIMPEYVINNAGIFAFDMLSRIPERKISIFIDLHIRAVTTISRAFATRFMEQGHGRILNMSSMSCWAPMPGLALYSATKAYIRVFTRSLHYEMVDSGATATVAAPGGIATDLFGLPPKLMKIALALHAVQTPEKFTRNAVRHMLRGKKQYINGWLNRAAIVFVSIMPTRVRLLVKHLMLDKGIVR